MPHRLMRPFAAAAALSAASLSYADGWKAFRDPNVQDFGHQWSTVGDPHNAAHLHWQPGFLPEYVGRVNYKYRVMTREVTVREWFDFVQAYAPYAHPDARASQQFIGTNGFIQFQGLSGGVPQYSMEQQFGDVPIQVGWRFAARYANFLHNDQAEAAWAFESGAYDTSTFGTIPGTNYFSDQQNRSESARYWIPSFDEWTKAGHWDPNRYGEGQGGWWEYPNTSDTAPVSGHPDFGGETNGGPFPAGQSRPLDVGSYPDVQSPWGLLDISGGAHEWTETITFPLAPLTRYVAGTTIYQTLLDPLTFDALGYHSSTIPSSFAGIRLASVIPSPGSILALAIGCSCSLRRRR